MHIFFFSPCFSVISVVNYFFLTTEGTKGHRELFFIPFSVFRRVLCGESFFLTTKGTEGALPPPLIHITHTPAYQYPASTRSYLLAGWIFWL